MCCWHTPTSRTTHILFHIFRRHFEEKKIKTFLFSCGSKKKSRMKKIMLTRSRSIGQLLTENDGAANDVSTNEKKKRKVNPPENSRRKTAFKLDVIRTKSKPNLDLIFESPQSVSNDNSSNTRKSPRKSNRTSTVTKSIVKQTKTKPSESSSLVPITEKTSEVHAYHNAIEQVLAANYVDVQKRLKLLYPAKCIQSLVTCSKEHARNSVRNLFVWYSILLLF